MKLNIDCVRDVLLTLEELLIVEIDEDEVLRSNSVDPYDVVERLVHYNWEDVFYAIKKLDEAGFIDGKIVVGADGLWHPNMIHEITYSGHEFLDKVRPPTVWESTKGVAQKIGSFSISVLSQIAGNVLSGMISGNIA